MGAERDGLLQRVYLWISSPTASTTRLVDVVTEADSLAQLTALLFSARHGALEWQSAMLESGMPPCQIMPPTGAITMRVALDAILTWLAAQPFAVALLQGLLLNAQQTTSSASNATARRKLLVHTAQWAAANPDGRGAGALHEELVVVGLTDVWSATRSSVAAILSDLLPTFALAQLEALSDRLSDICLAADTSWQAKEGALLGMTAVVRLFTWKRCSSEDAVSPGANTLGDRGGYVLAHADQELPAGFPAFVKRNIDRIIYRMLADPQLSVREHAARLFSAYLSRSQFREAVACFTAIMLSLRRLAPDMVGLDEAARRSRTFVYLDAYEAEGLLAVCLFIVRNMSPGFLLPNWPLYFATFELYLTHPASTVRQATSAIFKFLVAKDSSNPVMLQLVLQGLAADWVCCCQVCFNV